MEWNLEKVREHVRSGKYYYSGEDFVKYLSEMSEEDIIEGINHVKDAIEIAGFYNQIIKGHVTITHNIAFVLTMKCTFLYNHFQELFSEEDKQKIYEEYFNKIKNGQKLMYRLPSCFNITDEDWKYLIETDCNFYRYFEDREYIPEFVKEHFIKTEKYSIKYWSEYLGSIDAKYLILYLNTFKDSIDKGLIVDCPDMDIVVKECSWVFKYLIRPSQKIVNAAIEADPHNIQYVNKPTDKLRIKALSLDKSTIKYITKTKAVCEFLGIKAEPENPYPSKYYFCLFDEDLCDESNIIKTCIVKGKDMPDFMAQTCTKSFGNLDDDSEIEVKKIVNFKPITKEEIEVLKKFGVDDLESGYFSFSDDRF